MSTIFLVRHRRVLYDDVFSTWFIGYYSTEAKAFDAIARSRGLPGFCDFPEDFHVWEMEVDQLSEEEVEGVDDAILASIDESIGRDLSPPVDSSTQNVYEVEWFVELDEDVTDIHFIGVFSTRARADLVVEALVDLPTYRKNVDGFYVADVDVDVDHSTTGFFIPEGIEKRRPRPTSDGEE